MEKIEVVEIIWTMEPDEEALRRQRQIEQQKSLERLLKGLPEPRAHAENN
jgi:hypothetical protein